MIAIRKTLVGFLAVLVLSAGATLTQAQRQTYRGTTRSVRQLIMRIESRINILRNSLNAQNQTGVYGARVDQSLNNLVQDLDTSVIQLRDRFDRRESTSADAQEVLNRAAQVDRFFQRRSTRSAAVNRNWTNLRTDLSQLANVYNLAWPAISQAYPNPTYPNTNPTYPNNNPTYSSSLLTGTYRLDPSRSDDPGQAADRATQSIGYADRTRLRDQIAARLESPDQIAIDLRGRDVTIGSSRAPQISFAADGTERVEIGPNGQTIRARASLMGEQLTVSSMGDAGNQFNVTFDPIDNGRSLSVTRRVYVQGLTRPVVVQSIYQKTSDAARFDINTGPQTYPSPNPSGTDFIIQSGESVVAVMDNGLSTQTAREGDRFTAIVRQPSQYEGAIIEGHVTNVQRSGRITGRSQMTLNFDNIRLRDGRSYRFAGILESVRTNQGDTVSIDNEGSIRDADQTTKTVQRAAIGTAVGAIIGAIAGGGKGAAIGAIVGAGGGAGSVYVQGRDDLDLTRGTELTIRVTGPR
ncbi:MAG: YMGG-like glycine zipper-containing protein [Acidobacteriota bacterium]|nr:YMGG-like glycine zipper-containing protein [Acidobacteriota bacterium]